MTRLTTEQAEALGVTGSSVAVSAGAGCGKTTVLTERFLRAIDEPRPIPLGRLVALTFTNKAARELRDRVRRACRDRLRGGEDPARWRSMLRGLESARISTFHSYCGEILRAHAAEAGVDPGFVVVEESIAQALRSEALAATIRDRLSVRDRDLVDLGVEFGLRVVMEALGDLLGNRGAGDLRGWAERDPADLVDLWFRRWQGETRGKILGRLSEAAGPTRELASTTPFAHPKTAERIGGFLEACRRFDDAAALGGEMADAIGALRESAKVVGLTKPDHWPSDEVRFAIRDQFTEIRKVADAVLKAVEWDEDATRQAALQGIQLARLATQAREVYARIKLDRGVIDNDDMLVMARDLLADPDGPARKALAESVDLILVDEFQDTDPVQGEILSALAGQGAPDGRLFLVGDFKQSIYRFRGAEPDLFRRFREAFPVKGRCDLTLNFRSVPPILSFVNALFATTFTESGAALKPGVPDGLAARPLAPPVLFSWPIDPPAKEDKDRAGGEAEAAEDFGRRDEEARRLARLVRDRLGSAWPVRDRDGSVRPSGPGDVAILFRSLVDVGSVEAALAEIGLDYHLVGGSGFFATQEVLDVINVLIAVDDPTDSVALAGALRSPFFSLSDDALFWLAVECPGRLVEGIERVASANLDRLPEGDRPRLVRARGLLKSWRRAKDRASIAALVDRVLDESGFEASLLAEPLGDRKRANARKLVRMARRFDEQGGFTLADFVEQLRADLRAATKETQAATTDDGGPVIRLMSIHQSKGLEFPIVVLPDLDRRRPPENARFAFRPDLGPLVKPSDDPEDFDDPTRASLGWTIHRQVEREADDAEALRLFYVAVTRARDHLVLSSGTPPGVKPTSPSLKLLADRFDLGSGRFLGLLPEGWPAPQVEVVPTAPAPARVAPLDLARDRDRDRSTVGVAPFALIRSIERGLDLPRSVPSHTPRPIGRFVRLGPTSGEASGPGRVDRLCRAILQDPRALVPGELSRVADRAARRQRPAAPDHVVARAVEWVSAWLSTSAGRRLLEAVEVRRSIPWSVADLPGFAGTVFEGSTDLTLLDANGHWSLVQIEPPDAPATERLRLLLAARAWDRSARDLGVEQVRHASLTRWDDPAIVEVDDLGDAAVLEAIERSLATLGSS